MRVRRVVLSIAVALAATLVTDVDLAQSSATAGAANVRGWRGVDVGGSHTCGLRVDGTLWCWGNNGSGRLGDGTTEQRIVPTQVGSSNDWTAVSAGGSATCGLRLDHSLWCWGDNTWGQLGLGDRLDRYVPTRVPGPDDWTSISVGSATPCGLRADASLWCWGSNTYGEVGDGTTVDQLTPVRVGHPDDAWTMVAPGDGHACGLRSDQSLWCWGNNDEGQLGTGDRVEQHLPVAIAVGSTWLATATGLWFFSGHTCALATDQTLWCWGNNEDGELGTGDRMSRLKPAHVRGSARWTSIDVGGGHTCATKADQTTWCWGLNYWGQLGIGSTFDQTRPVQVGARRGWSESRAGLWTTCALRLDRTPPGLWCWGLNQEGEVGDGTRIHRLSPVRITLP